MNEKKLSVPGFLVSLIVFLGLCFSFAAASPETLKDRTGYDFGPVIKSSADTVYQVFNNGSLTLVNVQKGCLYIHTQRHPVEVQTANGQVRVEQGEVVVQTRSGSVKVEVRDGCAQLLSPVVNSHNQEKPGPLLLTAGETGHGYSYSEQERTILNGLGMHE